MGLLTFFGLDIGTTAVRVVQLGGKHPNRVVFRYGKSPIEIGLAQKNDTESLMHLANLIRETLVQSQITNS